VPIFCSLLLEPAIGLVGDTHRRRALVVGGGIGFAAAIGAIAAAPAFGVLLPALVVAYSTSGAFVSLSQASLMDLDPVERVRNMARWTLVGSAGVVAAPPLLAVCVWLGIGWRAAFAALAVVTLGLVVAIRRLPGERRAHVDLAASARHAFEALRRRDVLRWLLLLQLGDVMLDVFHGFLALYLVDVAGLTAVHAALAISIWTGVGLLGDLLLLAVLRRVSPLAYLRASAAIVAIAYPAFLLVPSLGAKLGLLALLGLLNAGWYAIPQARLYDELPGASGAVVAIGPLAGLAGGVLPLGIGYLAGAVGLAGAMWVMVAAPLLLLVALPRR